MSGKTRRTQSGGRPVSETTRRESTASESTASEVVAPVASGGVVPGASHGAAQGQGKEPIYLSWSGGKDCALALHELRSGEEYDVVRLHTTVTDAYDRSSIHGIRRPLLRTQARLLGLDVQEVVLPVPSSYDSYEEVMLEALAEVRRQGVKTIAFGDLLLEDVREYREQLLARAGLRAIFPLWGMNTQAAGERFIELGFRAALVAVDSERLTKQFVG